MRARLRHGADAVGLAEQLHASETRSRTNWLEGPRRPLCCAGSRVLKKNGSPGAKNMELHRPPLGCQKLTSCKPGRVARKRYQSLSVTPT